MKLAFVSLLVAASGSALADVIMHDNGSTTQVQVVNAQTTVQPGSGYDPRGSTILYNSSTETGFRYTPGGGTPADNRRVAFDDVNFSSALLNGATSIDVCRVTVGIRRLAAAPATSVDLYWATLSDTATSPDTIFNTPGNLIGTANLGVAGAATTTLVTAGVSGGPTLFNAPLNFNFAAGYGTFAIGVRFSDTGGNNGWRITTGAPNADLFCRYDPFQTAGGNVESLLFFNGNPVAQFYIVIEGNLVPAPGAFALVGMGGLIALRRRR